MKYILFMIVLVGTVSCSEPIAPTLVPSDSNSQSDVDSQLDSNGVNDPFDSEAALAATDDTSINADSPADFNSDTSSSLDTSNNDDSFTDFNSEPTIADPSGTQISIGSGDNGSGLTIDPGNSAPINIGGGGILTNLLGSLGVGSSSTGVQSGACTDTGALGIILGNTNGTSICDRLNNVSGIASVLNNLGIGSGQVNEIRANCGC